MTGALKTNLPKVVYLSRRETGSDPKGMEIRASLGHLLAGGGGGILHRAVAFRGRGIFASARTTGFQPHCFLWPGLSVD